MLDSWQLKKLNAELNGVCFWCGDDDHVSYECSDMTRDGDGAEIYTAYLSPSEIDSI